MPVEVKICGLTNSGDAQSALDAGADYLGFVFHPQSPRAVTSATVLKILDEIGKPVKAVGVLVNVPRAEVEKLVETCGLHAVQLCGEEKAEEFRDFPCRVWPVLRFAGGKWNRSPDEWKAERYVIDSATPGKYGGTGERNDWKSAAILASDWPVMLAGGLTPANVGEAIRAVKPTGVDVVSGVEAKPGVKDHAKIRNFIAIAKSGVME